MVFKLDAVDAYERKLVKQIEVAAASVEGGHNKAYVRLVSVSNKRGVITALLELDKQTATGVVRQIVPVQDGDNLEMTTGRAVYTRLPRGRNPRGGGRRVSWNCAFPAVRNTSASARPTATWSRWPSSAK